MIRRVKKTTNEQFDLLKAEMATHPAAARGYGVGNQRVIVDAEWKEIVEKLNAIGPPERTMTEWKKVWSDVRLRMKKKTMKKTKKLKKSNKTNVTDHDYEEDRLMEALNSNISIYETHIKNEHNEDKEQQELFVEDEYKAYKEDEEGNRNMDNSAFYETNCQQILQESPITQTNTLEESLIAVQQQLQQQHTLMKHLLEVSTNMGLLMERHLKAEEKKTNLMEKQLRLTESHNLYLRRKETKRKSKLKMINQGTN